MKAKPLKIHPNGIGYGYLHCKVEEATHIELNLPCPLNDRIIPIIMRGLRDSIKKIVWTWNGDTEKPTLKPSILTNGGVYSEDCTEYTKYRCHTWITNGEAQFLSDCTHENVNKTLPLLDVEDD